MSSQALAYILAALIGFCALAVGPVISSRLIAKRISDAADKAALAASDAKEAADQVAATAALATENARTGLLKAQKDAADAARLLIETARGTNAALNTIKTTVLETKAVSDGTHQIVNNQRTVLLRTLATALRVIADQNPKNMAALESARDAEKEATLSENAQAAISESATDRDAKAAIDAIK